MEVLSHSGFPNSYLEPFIKTSTETDKYNCIAWALHNDVDWFEPEDKYGSFWPNEVTKDYTVEAYIELFEHYQYVKCENGLLEEGYEKIAFFYSKNPDNNPDSFHAARQLNNGTWTSKLGDGIDVGHTLKSISNGKYGEVIQFFKKGHN